MAVAPILTQGLGSFGGVNLIPTLGFGVGDAAVEERPTVPGIEYTSGDHRLHYTADNRRLHWTCPDFRLHWTSKEQ